MFTGFVETTGRVIGIQKGTAVNPTSLEIEASFPTPSGNNVAEVGDSISVNGACLTVTSCKKISESFIHFSVDLSSETLKCTALGNLKERDPVNLERALSTSRFSRLGGHIVQGHIDTTGSVSSFSSDENDPNTKYMWITLGPQQRTSESFMSYIVPKGYIAVDGVSLTICEVDDTSQSFSVSLIPHTLMKTATFPPKSERDHIVNLEFDIIAKYVKRLVNKP